MPPDKHKSANIAVNENDSLQMTSKNDFSTNESDLTYPKKFKMNVGSRLNTSSPIQDPNAQGKNNHVVPKDPQSVKPWSLSDTLFYTLTCIVCAALTMEFSIRFPHVLSNAARMTFNHAWYKYDPSKTFFDNTFLTYGTDYIIFVLMTYASYKCASVPKESLSNKGMVEPPRKSLRMRAAALFACYAISVLAGGYAHQFYVTYADLETTSFRILWTICVGSVTLAGSFMGLCGSEINRFLVESRGPGNVVSVPTLFHVPTIPDSWWVLYGFYMTGYCIAGGISCFRPAADIFLAGVTQFIPTFYCEMVVWSRLWKVDHSSSARFISRSTRFVYYLGFILNAPLLPFYPYLIHHTNLSLGVVNALLHLNLTVSWGMQAISLYQICILFNNQEQIIFSSSPLDSAKVTRSSNDPKIQ